MFDRKTTKMQSRNLVVKHADLEYNHCFEKQTSLKAAEYKLNVSKSTWTGCCKLEASLRQVGPKDLVRIISHF